MAVELTATDYSGVGTGAPATYATGIYANASNQIKVYVAGVLQTIGDDYSLAGIGSKTGVDVIGSFTAAAAVYVERVTPITQEVDTENNETILEDVLDGALDKLTLIAQELDSKSDRALLVPKGEAGYVLPEPEDRAGKVLGFDLAGNPVVSTVAVPAAAAQPERLVLTLEQFGGGAQYASAASRGVDNTSALMQALDVINRYAPVNTRWPRVPRIELGLGAYYFSQKIDLKVACHLRGQGGGHDDFNGGTRFVFPTGVQGITVNSSDTINGTTETPTTSALGAVIEGIQIESEGGGTGWDFAAETSTQLGATAAANTYGLWLRTTCTIRDCVLKGWKGTALQIIAFAGAAGALRGNANGVLVDRLTVRENDSGTPSEGHGVFVYGSDSNTCDFRSVQVRHAGLIGIWEHNTLGNTWTNPRVDDFGRVARATSAAELGCFYSGLNYILIDWRAGIGAATVPGTNASIWYPIQAAGAASSLYPAWSGSGTYVCMLPFLFQGQSVTSTVINPYVEGGIPGHAGGNPSDPGTGVTVYGGQSQWTISTSRVYSVPSFGRGVASNSGFVARRPSILDSSDATNFGTYTEARLGDAAGEILRMRIERGGEVNYYHRFNASGDIIFDRDGQPPFWLATTHLSTRQNGRGAADPYSIGFPGLVLVDPADSGNNRHLGIALAAPTSGGPYAKGERVYNANPGPGRPEYWVCLVAGSPGTWLAMNVTPFQSGAATAVLTGSTSETVLATLPLPSGTLGRNGRIELDVLWSTVNNANTKTLRARLGGLTGFAFWSQATTTFVSARGQGMCSNRNATNSQVAFSGVATGAQAAAALTGAINTANAQDIVITGQLANAADSITVESYSARIIPSD